MNRFLCPDCDYSSVDPYTVEVISAVSGVCPICERGVTEDMFTVLDTKADTMAEIGRLLGGALITDRLGGGRW